MVAFPGSVRDKHKEYLHDELSTLIKSGVVNVEKDALNERIEDRFVHEDPNLHQLMQNEGPHIAITVLTDRWVQSYKGKVKSRVQGLSKNIDGQQRVFHLVPDGSGGYDLKYLLRVTVAEASEIATQYDQRVRQNTAPRNWWRDVVIDAREAGLSESDQLSKFMYIEEFEAA